MGGRMREDYRSSTGPKKSAILLMWLASIRRLSCSPISMMRRSKRSLSGRLGNVRSNVVERLFAEFAEQVSSTGWLVVSIDSTQRMLSKTFGEDRADDIMEKIRGPAGRTIRDQLDNVNEQALGNFLKNEYLQTVAVILGKIGQAHAPHRGGQQGYREECGAGATRRVHVQPGAHQPARQPRVNGRGFHPFGGRRKAGFYRR